MFDAPRRELADRTAKRANQPRREGPEKGAIGALVRSLSDYLADQRKRAADDRDLTSRSDRRKVRKETEEAFSDLARELCECSDKQLKQLELPELLRNCILDARRIESPAAKDRALRLVRRELRAVGVDAIRQQLEALASPHRKASVPVTEQWRNRLLDGTEAALSELLQEYPNADRQQVKQLVRNVQKADDVHRAKAVVALTQCLTKVIKEQTR